MVCNTIEELTYVEMFLSVNFEVSTSWISFAFNCNDRTISIIWDVTRLVLSIRGASVEEKPELKRVLEQRNRAQVLKQDRKQEKSPLEQELLKRQMRLEKVNPEITSLKLYWQEYIVWYTLIRLGSDPNCTECSFILIIFTSQAQNTLISGSKRWAVNHNIYSMYYNLIQKWFTFNKSSSQIEREVEEQRERSKCAPEFIRVKESLKRMAITSAVEKEL